MAKAQLYMLRLGYQEIGVGTITQVQAAQKALEALQHCAWIAFTPIDTRTPDQIPYKMGARRKPV